MAGAMALFLAAGCGDGGGSGGTAGAYAAFSCTASFRQADGGAAVPVVCAEASTATADQVNSNRQKCESEKSTFTLSACSRQGVAGACRVSQGATSITTWYYADNSTTPDSVRHLCEGLAGTSSGLGGVTVVFVPPP
jgi:hypothetical protein